MKVFKTPAGQELPIRDIRGSDYLDVKHRFVWFREVHPDWTVETEFIERDDNYAIAKATIKNELGRVIATAHKFEDSQGFKDFLEKAETSAIGRALAACGFGTQFATELEEGERLADSPVERKVAGMAPPIPMSKVPPTSIYKKDMFSVRKSNSKPKEVPPEGVGGFPFEEVSDTAPRCCNRLMMHSLYSKDEAKDYWYCPECKSKAGRGA